ERRRPRFVNIHRRGVPIGTPTPGAAVAAAATTARPTRDPSPASARRIGTPSLLHPASRNAAPVSGGSAGSIRAASAGPGPSLHDAGLATGTVVHLAVAVPPFRVQRTVTPKFGKIFGTIVASDRAAPRHRHGEKAKSENTVSRSH